MSERDRQRERSASGVLPAEAGLARLRAHERECLQCSEQPLPLEEVARALHERGDWPDASALSARALMRVRPELAPLANAAWWRRVAVGMALAFIPLPFVLVYDGYVLGKAYTLASALLSERLAAYLVWSYGTTIVLLLAATYASIPVLLERPPRSDQQPGGCNP